MQWIASGNAIAWCPGRAGNVRLRQQAQKGRVKTRPCRKCFRLAQLCFFIAQVLKPKMA
jgi:hypothetical protein